MAGITGLNSASIFVADLPLHVDFYTNQLGFTFVHDESSERAAMLEAGDFRLLLHDGGPTAASSNLATHINLKVDDIDAYWEQLRNHGLDMPEQPQDRPWGRPRSISGTPPATNGSSRSPIRTERHGFRSPPPA